MIKFAIIYYIVTIMGGNDMKRRIVSVFFMACMLIILVPATVRASANHYSGWKEAGSAALAAGDTVTIEGEDYVYQSDVSETGLDLTTALPSANAIYKAGSGYILFTPAVTQPAANAQLALVGAVIDLSAKKDSTNAIFLPDTAQVDITVTGSNTLKATDSGYGIGEKEEQPVNITGSGSLTVGGYSGIRANKAALRIDIEGVLGVTAGQGSGIYCSEGNMKAEDINITGYFCGSFNSSVSMTAVSGNIDITSTGGLMACINASGDITLDAAEGAVNISSPSYGALRSSAGNVTVRANHDITLTSVGTDDTISGAAVSLTSASGSISVKGYTGIKSTSTLTVSAPGGDILLGANSSGNAIVAINNPVTVTAGETVSSSSRYGWETGTLTIKASHVAISGTQGNALSSGGNTHGIIITGSNGGNCTGVTLNADAEKADYAAVNCEFGDVTILADSMLIQGKGSAKVIMCGQTWGDKRGKILTLTGAGYVIGTCALNPDKEAQTATISKDVEFRTDASGVQDWTKSVDLSSVTKKTILTGNSGFAVWEPVLDTDKKIISGKLTLNSVNGSNLTLPLVPVEIVCNSANDVNGITAADKLTISGGGSLSLYDIMNENGIDTALNVDSDTALNTEYIVRKNNEPTLCTFYGNYTIDSQYGRLTVSDSNKVNLTPGAVLTLSDAGYLDFNKGTQLSDLTIGESAKIINNTHITFPEGTTAEQIAVLPISGPGEIRIASEYDIASESPSSYDVLLFYVSADAAKGSVTPAYEQVDAKKGTAVGAAAAPVNGCTFISWTDKDGKVVSKDANFHPAKLNDVYVGGTYTANFSGSTVVPVLPAEPGVTGITAAEPAKTAYLPGQLFDPSDMAVTVIMSDGKTKKITDYTVTPAVLSKGDTSVTIQWKDSETGQTFSKVIPVSVTEASFQVPTLKLGKTVGIGTPFSLQLTGLESTAHVICSSADPSVAEVNSDGSITGRKAGKTTVTCQVEQNGALFTYQITVTVNPLVKSNYNLKPGALPKLDTENPVINLYKSLRKGKSHVLKLAGIPENAKVRYSVNNSRIATVSKNGKITGKKAGFAIVTAKVTTDGNTVIYRELVLVTEKGIKASTKKYLE